MTPMVCKIVPCVICLPMIWNPFRPARPAPRDVDAELTELEAKAEEASPAYRGQAHNRAGDVAASAGDVSRALRYWGQAIDEYLEVARPEAAAAICRKVIRQAPGVVRARRTLALLAIGQGYLTEALEQVEAYVAAAVAADQEELAVKQLRLMGEATWSTRFRRRVAELLAELGDADASAYVARALPLTHEAEDGAIPAADHDRWSTILRVALMPPDEVRRAL